MLLGINFYVAGSNNSEDGKLFCYEDVVFHTYFKQIDYYLLFHV